MSEPPPPPIDIPPPPEAERLADLKARRDELEQKLADEKAKLKRMQADRRALLRKQIKQARSRLSTAERKRRNQRLIQLGLLAEARAEADPAQHARNLKDLDARLTRTDLRALFGLPPLDKPSKPSPTAAAPSALRADRGTIRSLAGTRAGSPARINGALSSRATPPPCRTSSSACTSSSPPGARASAGSPGRRP